ncbi:MAG: LysE family transporter [Saprospiraceae bacterium]|nr:LysE family transporter [Candidatus Vicinibacter affinis]
MDLYHNIGRGIAIGLMLTFMVGPVFFALIRISIIKGFKNGFYFAAGICISDALVCLLSLFLMEVIIIDSISKNVLGLLGGAFMVGFGINGSLTRNKPEDKNEVIPRKTLPLGLQGFLFNSLNPFVYFFWLGINATVSFDNKSYTFETLSFYCSILITVFSIDLLKVYLAHKLAKFLNHRIIFYLNFFLSLGLILFGLYVIYFIVMIK